MMRKKRSAWRSGWRGQLLRRHSPSGELLGTCWCQRKNKPFQEEFSEMLEDVFRKE